MDLPGVTVIIPTIRGREKLLRQAVASVKAQQYLGELVISVQKDEGREGPAAVRNRGLEESSTEYVAFLDDDDECYPTHVQDLVDHALVTGADLVYPWFDLYRLGRLDNNASVLSLRGGSPMGQRFDEESAEVILTHGNFIPVTVLIRRQALVDVGGFVTPNTEEWPHPDCEDWGTWQRLLRAGAKFEHFPHRTWRWNHHGLNTSGRPERARQIYR